MCEHLAREQSHFKVEFDSDFFAQVGDGVETAAVSGFDMNWDKVAVMLYGFLDNSCLPIQVDNFAFDTSRAESCGEVQQHIVVRKSRGDARCGGAITVYFIDGDKNTAQIGEVHKEVIDREFYIFPHSYHSSPGLWILWT